MRSSWRRALATACLAGSCVALVAAVVAGRSSAGASDTSSAAAEVIPAGLFVGDFDVSAPGWQQYSGLQREIERPEGETFSLVRSPVRQGSAAARFAARQGYSRWGHNEDTEVVLFGGEKRGDDYWYAWSTLFPRDWEAPHAWGIFAQWHANLGTSPIVSLNARSDTATLHLLSGLTDEDANRTEVNREVRILSSLAKGQWNDFLLHVRWSTEPNGLLELYHRVKGAATMRRVAFVQNVPTFQVTREGRGLGTYLLFGIYRGSLCPQPTELSCSVEPAQAPSVLYHDGFTRSAKYEEAARRAFPGPVPKLVVGQETGSATTAAPLALSSRASVSARAVERGASLAVGALRLSARVTGPRDDRDTAVAVYRVTQRRALVVRGKLRVTSRGGMSGNAVVTQVRNSRGKLVAELFVDGKDRTLSVYSPPGALQSDDINVSTNVAAKTGSVRAVELRITPTQLVLVVDRKVRLVVDVDGPAAGARLVARVGIDHYDGTQPAPLGVTFDRLDVGVAG